MPDDLAVVVQAEDVHSSPIGAAWPPLITVQDRMISFGNHALKLDVLAGVLTRHAFKVFNEGLFSVSDHRVVLDVLVTDVALDCLGRLALIEHQIVKRPHCVLVLLSSLRVIHGLPPPIVHSICWYELFAVAMIDWNSNRLLLVGRQDLVGGGGLEGPDRFPLGFRARTSPRMHLQSLAAQPRTPPRSLLHS